MTRRPLHSAFAALWRGGAAVSKAASALERVEAGGSQFDVAFSEHPLVAGPAWGNLLQAVSSDARMAEQLTALARRSTPSVVSVRASAERPLADMMPSGAVAAQAPYSEEAKSSQVAQPVATNAQETPARGALEPGRRKALGPSVRRLSSEAGKQAVNRALASFATQEPGSSAAGPTVPTPLRAQKPHTLVALKRQYARHAMTGLSDIAKQAAKHPVGASVPASGAQRAAVTRLLQGEPAIAPAAVQPPTARTESEAEKQLLRLLARVEPLPAAATAAPLKPAPFVTEKRSGPQSLPDTEPSVRKPLPAPRNGIERLLAEARKQNLVTADLHEDKSGTQAPPVPASSDRRSRGIAPERSAMAFEPPDIAKALTDMIRREARAAGIDLKGGRS